MEMVSKQHQQLAMPMLAEVLSWHTRVMHEPVAAPVANVLEKCAERLAALFTRYIQDMVRCLCTAATTGKAIWLYPHMTQPGYGQSALWLQPVTEQAPSPTEHGLL